MNRPREIAALTTPEEEARPTPFATLADALAAIVEDRDRQFTKWLPSAPATREGRQSQE
jgi:hypothetical protein